mmetsp:Transcript_18634/g.52387  ORF Transcript_18634/g.52387 Transcript_18634/m.52387 type:complete len:219 (-) Transcript_18634:603-1259(-)
MRRPSSIFFCVASYSAMTASRSLPLIGLPALVSACSRRSALTMNTLPHWMRLTTAASRKCSPAWSNRGAASSLPKVSDMACCSLSAPMFWCSKGVCVSRPVTSEKRRANSSSHSSGSYTGSLPASLRGKSSSRGGLGTWDCFSTGTTCSLSGGRPFCCSSRGACAPPCCFWKARKSSLRAVWMSCREVTVTLSPSLSVHCRRKGPASGYLALTACSSS